MGRGQRIDDDNPDKNLLVIECVDSHYRKMPLLYGHPSVAGSWLYVPNGINPAIKHTLDEIAAYNAPGVRGIKDVADIEEWWLGSSRYRFAAPEGVINAEELLNPNGYSAVGLPSALGESAEPTKTRLHAPNRSLSTPKSHLTASVRPTTANRAQKNDDDEVDEPPPSAYDEVKRLRRAQEVRLAAYVLEGADIQTGDANIDHVKQTLRQLAGTVELADPNVLFRYQQLNASLHSNGTPTGELLAALVTSRHTAKAPSPHFEDISPFRPKGAKCAAPQDHDVERLQHHVDTFFPGRGASTKPAREHCIGCAAVQECLEYAMDNNLKFGIWGGMSERERRRVRQVRSSHDEAASKTLIDATWRKNRIAATYTLRQASEEDEEVSSETPLDAFIAAQVAD